jgi:hypothetical protein
VSLLVLSPEIGDRDGVEVANWTTPKKTFYSELEDKIFDNFRQVTLFCLIFYIVCYRRKQYRRVPRFSIVFGTKTTNWYKTRK